MRLRYEREYICVLHFSVMLESENLLLFVCQDLEATADLAAAAAAVMTAIGAGGPKKGGYWRVKNLALLKDGKKYHSFFFVLVVATVLSVRVCRSVECVLSVYACVCV